MTLGITCFNKVGTLVHELLHALGLSHEQQRRDRSQYIRIRRDNIRPGYREFFRHKRALHVFTAGIPYDYQSILHYSPYAFTKSSESKTIKPITRGANIGQRIRLSRADIARLNRLYGCTHLYLGDDIPGAVPYPRWLEYREMMRRKCGTN